MTRSLRRGNERIDVTYRGGDTDSLIARHFVMETNEHYVRFSMDLSPNERTRSKDSNINLDVKKLIERAAEVESFQLSKDKWLNPLGSALRKNREASWELVITFKDSPSHTYKFDLEATGHDLYFQVASTGKPSQDESPHKAC